MTASSRISPRRKHAGSQPAVVRLPRIALDIDTPEDVALFLEYSSRTRAHGLLTRWRERSPRWNVAEGNGMSANSALLDRAAAGHALAPAEAMGARGLRRSFRADGGRRRVARRGPWRARVLFAQGVHSAHQALPRFLPLLHLRPSAAPQHGRLPDARRGRCHRARGRQGRLQGSPVHARRQT